MVLVAAGWVQVEIAASSERMREAAAVQLGTLNVDRIEQPIATAVEGQLALPL